MGVNMEKLAGYWWNMWVQDPERAERTAESLGIDLEQLFYPSMFTEKSGVISDLGFTAQEIDQLRILKAKIESGMRGKG